MTTENPAEAIEPLQQAVRWLEKVEKEGRTGSAHGVGALADKQPMAPGGQFGVE
jgi:hypothetical protein